ncbi:hypothetical protein C7T94_01015 [Pedobacter yulinensis]|uniref:Glycerophosphoryl diester phosphodiesterase membrane domain-containing protein n=1 Tax=Pedobacter yulinensis TaxID=2126353 RepID=A0A2T3HQR7_9SPHI|nr:hypothetical protein [Pedobacter yulinensis]PST84741.1 hypothetical protein C7T94_01015 [Pedobacter yulinensis]
MRAQKIDLRKNRDFGELVNDSFLFLRQNFKSLVRIFFMYCGLFVVGGMIAMIFQQIKNVSYYNGVLTQKRNPGPFDMFSQFGFEYVLALLSMWVSFTLMTVSVVSFMALYAENDKTIPTNEQLWQRIKETFLRTLGSSVVWFILLLVGSVLCVVPGVYLFPVCSLFYVVLITEKCSFGEAWTKSFRLIKNNWWMVFGVLFVMYVIVYFSTTLITLPTTIMTLVGVLGESSPRISLTFSIIGTVLQFVCQVFLILPTIASCLVFYSLSEHKDGAGLLERIAAFQQAGNAADERPESY